MNVFYKKQKATKITYCSYIHFSNELFMTDVHNRIFQVTSENNDLEFDLFKAALNEAIQRHAPINSNMFMQIKLLSYIKQLIKKSRNGHDFVFLFKYKK